MGAGRVSRAFTDLAKELLRHRISGVALPLERDELQAAVRARWASLRVDDPAGALVEIADLRLQCWAVRVPACCPKTSRAKSIACADSAPLGRNRAVSSVTTL